MYAIRSYYVILKKKSTFLELDFQISGYVEIICDRCLDEYHQEIDYEGKFVITSYSIHYTKLYDLYLIALIYALQHQ